MKSNNNGIGFAIESNVFIDVVSPQNMVTQSIHKHNKATKGLVSGMLRFLRGEFNTSFRQKDESKIAYKSDAKKYIPCYVGIGTGGIITEEKSESGINYIAPKVDLATGLPITETDWNSKRVSFNQTKLNNEPNINRYEISALLDDNIDEYVQSSGDIEQFVLYTEISPGHYSSIYGIPTDIYITELGLFPKSTAQEPNLLAAVLLKNTKADAEKGIKEDIQILHVRPQDTIVVKWIISIIALDDWSFVEEDSTVDDIDIQEGTRINDNIPFNGSVEKIIS